MGRALISIDGIYYIGGVFMFSMLSSIPYAEAAIAGKAMYPDISGSVMLYEVYGGTLVVVSVKNLSDERIFLLSVFFFFAGTCIGHHVGETV